MAEKLEKTATPGIYKRGSRYVVVFRDPSGKQKKRFARTLAEARDVKAQLRADVTRGEYRASSKITFAEYAETWIDTYTGRTSRGLRDVTRDDYRKALARDAIPYFGRRKLAEIEPRDIKLFAAHVAGRGVAANTVRLSLAPVKALFATAVEEGLIRSNPTAGVRLAAATPTVDQEGGEERRVKALTADELERFLAAVPDGYRLFFDLLAQTGLRVGEAIALQWGDVDFGRRRVHVRRRRYRGTVAAPKSRYGVRAVPIAPGLAQRLWEARKAAADPSDGATMFLGATGQPLDHSNVLHRVVKPAARAAGVGWAGFHTLRHTCATMLFRNGWNAVQVQIALGHHSPAFTLATYVHLLPDDLPAADFWDRPGVAVDSPREERGAAEDSVEPSVAVRARG